MRPNLVETIILMAWCAPVPILATHTAYKIYNQYKYLNIPSENGQKTNNRIYTRK